MTHSAKARYRTASHWQVMTHGGLSFVVKQITWSVGAYNNYGFRLMRRLA